MSADVSLPESNSVQKRLVDENTDTLMVASEQLPIQQEELVDVQESPKSRVPLTIPSSVITKEIEETKMEIEPEQITERNQDNESKQSDDVANAPLTIPSSFFINQTKEHEIGLVKFSLKITSSLGKEDFIEYLKYVLTYECLSDNRLGNVDSLGNCEFYFKNELYYIPILNSNKTEDYYSEIAAVIV